MSVTAAMFARRRAVPVAPVWHTAGVLVLLSIPVLFALRGSFASASHHVIRYAAMMSLEWAITAFIWFGIGRSGGSPEALAGEFSTRFRAIVRDIGIALGFLVAANIVLGITQQLTHAKATEAVRNLLPRGGAEIAMWLLLALTAGICEELIFRGYFQQQFTAWTRSAALGIIIQALLFGVSHLYQGWGMVWVISIYGCMFGLLAHWRRSLRPGMMAHFLQDGVMGVVAGYAFK